MCICASSVYVCICSYYIIHGQTRERVDTDTKIICRLSAFPIC